MAHPGTLPVINREAVKKVLLVGTALRAQLADYTEFDRKNYFYPDLPKGYQISQYEFPLVSRGTLNGITITRIHLEEDTARSLHDETAGTTLIDYNRAGVPLMELVTEPEIKSATEAARFAKDYQLLLRYLGASEANMEKGEMRVEANVSVSNTKTFGTKVEIKNLNSFKAVERAIEFEIQRQISCLERGETIVQETRGWDDVKQATFSQRVKETSADYRYFPDPDLPKLVRSAVPEFSDESLRSDLPELPEARKRRYIDLGLKTDDADMFVSLPYLGDSFDEVIKSEKWDAHDPRVLLAANYLANDVAGMVRDTGNRDTDLQREFRFAPVQFGNLMTMVMEGSVGSMAAKFILPNVLAGEDPQSLVKQRGMAQISSEYDLMPVIIRICESNPRVVEDLKGGKGAALQFLIGQVMKETRGAADPGVAAELFRKHLGI